MQHGFDFDYGLSSNATPLVVREETGVRVFKTHFYLVRYRGSVRIELFRFGGSGAEDGTTDLMWQMASGGYRLGSRPVQKPAGLFERAIAQLLQKARQRLRRLRQ